MKIELKKKTNLLGSVDYFIYVDDRAVECRESLESAEELFNQYVTKAKAPEYETLKSEEI